MFVIWQWESIVKGTGILDFTCCGTTPVVTKVPSAAFITSWVWHFGVIECGTGAGLLSQVSARGVQGWVQRGRLVMLSPCVLSAWPDLCVHISFLGTRIKYRIRWSAKPCTLMHPHWIPRVHWTLKTKYLCNSYAHQGVVSVHIWMISNHITRKLTL